MKQHPFASEMKRWILLTELAMFLLFYQLCSGAKTNMPNQERQKPELNAIPLERATRVNAAPTERNPPTDATHHPESVDTKQCLSN